MFGDVCKFRFDRRRPSTLSVRKCWLRTTGHETAKKGQVARAVDVSVGAFLCWYHCTLRTSRCPMSNFESYDNFMIHCAVLYSSRPTHSAQTIAGSNFTVECAIVVVVVIVDVPSRYLLPLSDPTFVRFRSRFLRMAVGQNWQTVLCVCVCRWRRCRCRLALS